MRKVSLGIATVLLAGGLTLPVFGTDALLRKADAPDKNFEAYLPPLNFTAPWLNMDSWTKLPKGDYPLGRNEVGPLILRPPQIQHADLAEFALGGS